MCFGIPKEVSPKILQLNSSDVPQEVYSGISSEDLSEIHAAMLSGISEEVSFGFFLKYLQKEHTKDSLEE